MFWDSLARAIELCAGEARREHITIEEARKQILAQMRRMARSESR